MEPLKATVDGAKLSNDTQNNRSYMVSCGYLHGHAYLPSSLEE